MGELTMEFFADSPKGGVALAPDDSELESGTLARLKGSWLRKFSSVTSKSF
jgi:hypothetical protein